MVNSNGFSSWDSSTPTGNSWEKANDPCPPGWRVPTHAELQSLISSGSRWRTLNGVRGRLFGSGPHTVFLPAAGNRNNSNGALNNEGSAGSYWSGTPDISTHASYLGFGSGHASTYSNNRSFGYSVRCVSE